MAEFHGRYLGRSKRQRSKEETAIVRYDYEERIIQDAAEGEAEVPALQETANFRL